MQKRICSALFVFLLVSSAQLSAYPQQSLPFPEGCGNPFARQDEFDQFFEATLASLAIEKGPTGRTIAELYATNELRKEFTHLDPSYSMNNPISQHIKTQICVFEKVKLRENPELRSLSQLDVNSKNSELHKHLQAVGAKMLRDSRKVFASAKKDLDQRQKERSYFKSRGGIIRSATQKGRAKIKDLL
jgi:hypothetical protein